MIKNNRSPGAILACTDPNRAVIISRLSLAYGLLAKQITVVNIYYFDNDQSDEHHPVFRDPFSRNGWSTHQ